MTLPSSARSVVERLPDVRLIAAGIGVVIVIFGVAGTIVGTGATPGKGVHSHSPFHLINERTIPAFFSAALLAAGGAAAYVAGSWRVSGARTEWLIFGFVLFLMGLDEVGQLHEKVEKWTGTDWQTVYLPVFLGAAVVWWRLMRVIDRDLRVLLAGGAVAWAISQALEFLQYDSQDRRVAGFEPMAITEEMLEMVGSTLFLLAIVVALRRSLEPRARP
jgi:hypothetical protein